MSARIRYHWQLDVYKLSVEAAMEIFELSKKFPRNGEQSRPVAAGPKKRESLSPMLALPLSRLPAFSPAP